jgi:cell division septal protein FtsQ
VFRLPRLPGLRRGRRLRGAPAKARRLKVANKRQRPSRRRPAAPLIPSGGRGLARLLAKAGGLVLVFLAVGAALVGGWAWLASRPAFAVAEAQVLGTRHLSRLEVLSAAGLGVHSNLLSLNVGRMEARLATLPWVERARVERRPPATVRITVTERRPSWLAVVEGRLYFLAPEMEGFAPLQGGEVPDLPAITGLSRADLVQPDEEARRLLGLARGLREVLPASEFAPGGRLSEVHLDRVWGVTLVWKGLPPLVRLGFGDFARRLARLERVAADLEARGELKRAVLIDLGSDRRAVVRLAAEEAA